MLEQRLTKKEKKELRKLEWQQKADKEKRNAQFKKYGIIGGTVLVIILSIVGLVKLASMPSTTSSITVAPISKKDITLGDPKAKVTLIEYSDFQCPACAAYYPIVKQMLSEFGTKIYFAYRFFPLTNIHPNAQISAQAAYAAHKQGKFFEMESYLFTKQKEWAELQDPTTAFSDYALLLKLDVDKFKTDMNSDETKTRILDSQAQASTAGINSTPSFFLNGIKLDNPANLDAFRSLIQNEINKK